MSPVTTKVSGLPSKLPGQTVVSSVLGRQFSNITASAGSAMPGRTRVITASTATLVKWRSPIGGRAWGNAVPGASAQLCRPAASTAAAPFNQSLRLIPAIACSLA